MLCNLDSLRVPNSDTLTMYGSHIVLVQWSLVLMKVTAHLHIVLMPEVCGILPLGMAWYLCIGISLLLSSVFHTFFRMFL
jgi:hypothetical protein